MASRKYPSNRQEWIAEANRLDGLIKKEAFKARGERNEHRMGRLWEQRHVATLAAGYDPNENWPTDRRGNRIGQQLLLSS